MRMTPVRIALCWRVLQAVGASLLIATALSALDGIPIADPCETCLAVHPWWWCTFVMMCW